MRYLLALLCPPAAFLACKKWVQAIPATILFVLAVLTVQYGVGALIDVFLILWAIAAVGDDRAHREAQAFTRTVEPIPFVRS